MIRFTEEGVFADSEEERLAFYDKLTAGDPVVMIHLELWRRELALAEVDEEVACA